MNEETPAIESLNKDPAIFSEANELSPDSLLNQQGQGPYDINNVITKKSQQGNTALRPALAESDNKESRETSPQGRYVKLEDRLGSGAYKDVFRAYDTNNGIEVAWNVVKLNRVPPNERKRIKTEVKLLKDIEHKNVIKYFNSWVDREKEQIIFITEIMSSGSLKDYLRKNTMIRWNAVKRWCRQILRGLEFLHANHIIHRDIKCDNIFINGATGDLRIGDLGLSTRITEERNAGAIGRPITAEAMTCLGTPEFMAPEMYEESYNERVDIYAFGMCVLEMVTGLIPYHVCTSAAQIYKKVLNGDLPPELDMVERSGHTHASRFIRSCLQKKDDRPTASQLLEDKFFVQNEKEDYEEVRSKFSLSILHTLNEEDDAETDQIYINEDGGDRTHISRSDSNLNISDDGSLDDDQDRAARQFRDQKKSKRAADSSTIVNPVDEDKKGPSPGVLRVAVDPSSPSAAVNDVALYAGAIAEMKSNAISLHLSSGAAIAAPEMSGAELSEKKASPVELLVTVFDVTDHESIKDSLTFHLRLPSTSTSTSLAVSSPRDSEEKGSQQPATAAMDKEREKAADADLSHPNLSAADQQLEIEFEFDLHSDDSSSVIDEMAQLEDLANTAVSKTQIMDAFHPFVLAARRIMGQRTPSLSSPGDSESGPVSVAADLAAGTNTFSLAKAAIAEVLSSTEGSSNPSFRILRKRLATQPNQQPGVVSSSVGNPTENVISPVSSQQTEAAPSSASDTSLSVAVAGDSTADHIRTDAVLLPEEEEEKRNSGSSSGSIVVIGQDQQESIDQLVERMLEASPEYKEINSKYLDAVVKLEKEHAQRMSSMTGQREKLEQSYRKDVEQLANRKSDLDKQLDIMQMKYKERMAEFSLRKNQVLEEQLDKKRQLSRQP